jgi:hypothetical protein
MRTLTKDFLPLSVKDRSYSVFTTVYLFSQIAFFIFTDPDATLIQPVDLLEVTVTVFRYYVLYCRVKSISKRFGSAFVLC